MHVLTFEGLQLRTINRGSIFIRTQFTLAIKTKTPNFQAPI